MRRPLLAVWLVVLVACGGPQEFGSGVDTDIEGTPGAAAVRATATPAPTPGPASTQAPVATPGPQVTPKPTPKTFFDVTLTGDSPYFEPGNALVMSVGTTLRVTNEDRTKERPTRSFTADDGSFDSGRLKPGDKWTRTFTEPGKWRVSDSEAGFIFATLEVK